MKPDDLIFAQFLVAENVITQREIDAFKFSRSLSFKLYLLAEGILNIDEYREMAAKFAKLKQELPEQNLAEQKLFEDLEQSNENIGEEALPKMDLSDLDTEKKDTSFVSVPMRKLKSPNNKQEKKYQISPPDKIFNTNTKFPVPREISNNNFPEISFPKKEEVEQDKEKESQKKVSSIYEKKKLLTPQMHISQNFLPQILN